MAVQSPKESVYYYECSNGHFRLFYFIPPGELKRLCDENQISERILKDYPDGVDLGCTEAYFKEFEDLYGYRLPLDPSALHSAFFAILSSTRNWKKFRGSGFIPSKDLEHHLDDIDNALLEKKIAPKKAELPSERPSIKQFRRRRYERDLLQSQSLKTLKSYQVKGIDPKRTLFQQEFRKIKWAKGERAEEVFLHLHQKQEKRRK